MYGISKSGSDWEQYKVMELATKQTLSETIDWVKVSGVAWQGDGFYYSRYDAPAEGKELSSSNDDHKVFYHRVNTAQAADELVFEDKAHLARASMHLTLVQRAKTTLAAVIAKASARQAGTVYSVTPVVRSKKFFSPASCPKMEKPRM